MRTVPAARPREDHGFFGPGSPTWLVWTHPAAFIAFQRAVTIETLDPFLTAAVNSTRGVYTNPARRFERTARYFLTVAVGDGRAAIEASDVLHRVHARVVGTDPVSGRPFSANDPDSQLWIHVTAWHSLLTCYERYGPGRLSETDESQYWRECAIAAELQTIDVSKVPRSRVEVQRYFESMRPQLALSESGRELFFHLLRPRVRRDALALTVLWRMSSRASIATMPRWMRQLAGIRQPWFVDLVVRVVTRLFVLCFAPLGGMLVVLERLAPSARTVLEEALRGPDPLEARTVTPAQARERCGRPQSWRDELLVTARDLDDALLVLDTIPAAGRSQGTPRAAAGPDAGDNVDVPA